jgi:membrane-bound lytic murein transglycosylase MltF
MTRNITTFIAIALLTIITAQHQAAQAQDTAASEANEGYDETAIIHEALAPWTGDLDGIIERQRLRVSVPHNPLAVAYDGEKRIGLAVEIERELEAWLEETLDTGIDVILMPMPRDRLLPAVLEGQADLSMGNWTVTPERSESYAFTDPIRTGVDEILVTGPAAPDVVSFDDLARYGLYLRTSSSYHAHIQSLNEDRIAKGLEPIPVSEANPLLEDYDLLDLVNAGIAPAIIVDNHKAEFWAQLFPDIKLHPELTTHSGGEIAWALRPDSSKLLAHINSFVAKIRKGTLLGNILINRYLGSIEWIDDIRNRETMGRFDEVAPFIQTHSQAYEFDWIMVLAQAYQESKLDHSLKSPAGAVGVMQILPDTAADPNVAIPDISTIDNNVHAGVRYLRFLRERYFSDPEITDLDQTLLSFAAYNAGPANIAKARKKATELGLDPNVWFDNVETATARTVSREPVIYVRNIFKYYVAFQLSVQTIEQRQQVIEEMKDQG